MPVEATTPDITADVHLQRLLAQETDQPWFKTIYQDFKEYFLPPPLPPLEVTAKPVAVREIWGAYGGQGKRAGATSMLIHVSVVALMFLLSTSKMVQDKVRDLTPIFVPDLAPYKPQTPKSGGGGGGDRSPLQAAKGQLPKPAPRQFVPPQQVINNPDPKLVLEPTIQIPQDANIPNTNLPQWGDPLARIGPPSNGGGIGGGIGGGTGGGIGNGRGPGLGNGVGPGVYRIGGGVSAPQLIQKIEPEYSEEARKAKFQGTVVLSVVVDDKGIPRDLRVVRSLGLGLDEKAVEAVQRWRFRPGMLNGKPVAVAATIEVNFRLL